jgi:hypothetical protein
LGEKIGRSVGLGCIDQEGIAAPSMNVADVARKFLRDTLFIFMLGASLPLGWLPLSLCNNRIGRYFPTSQHQYHSQRDWDFDLGVRRQTLVGQPGNNRIEARLNLPTYQQAQDAVFLTLRSC